MVFDPPLTPQLGVRHLFILQPGRVALGMDLCTKSCLGGLVLVFERGRTTQDIETAFFGIPLYTRDVRLTYQPEPGYGDAGSPAGIQDFVGKLAEPLRTARDAKIITHDAELHARLAPPLSL